MYVLQIGQLRDSRAILTEQRDTLVSRLSTMMTDFEGLQTENDTINVQLTAERQRADSLMDRMKQERTWSANKIRDYQKELGTLRLAMQGYVRQIDSLNTLVQHVSQENVAIRREINTERLRADMAEERASELDVKVRRGAMILARNIRLTATNQRGNEVSRAGRAAGLQTGLVLTANELASPGEREVFVRILDRNGYVLANSANATIEIDGERLSYSASRVVEYDNKDLDVTIYYSGGNIVEGKYTVLVYMDGAQIGSTEVSLK
jgi:uncharacterized coiled-coil DUF342 family protein